MKEDVMQIAVDNGILYALCKGGNIYVMDVSDEKSGDWLLLVEAPKKLYKRAKA